MLRVFLRAPAEFPSDHLFSRCVRLYSNRLCVLDIVCRSSAEEDARNGFYSLSLSRDSKTDEKSNENCSKNLIIPSSELKNCRSRGKRDLAKFTSPPSSARPTCPDVTTERRREIRCRLIPPICHPMSRVPFLRFIESRRERALESRAVTPNPLRFRAKRIIRN